MRTLSMAWPYDRWRTQPSLTYKALPCFGYLVVWMETSDPPVQKPLQISLCRNKKGGGIRKIRGRERKKEVRSWTWKKGRNGVESLPLDLANWMGRVSEVWVWDNLWSAGASASMNRPFLTVAPETWHAQSAQRGDPRPPHSEVRDLRHPRTPTCSALAMYSKHFGKPKKNPYLLRSWW